MKRKNILFIMADQMAAPMLPFYGPSPIKLPNLSRLAEQGVVFDAAYCNSPLCAPSRFTLVSGQLPSKIGAYDNAADFPADVPTYAHYLRRLGYRTALSGRSTTMRSFLLRDWAHLMAPATAAPHEPPQ